VQARSLLVLAATLLLACATTAAPPLPRGTPPQHTEAEAHGQAHGAGAQSVSVFVGGSEEVRDRDGFTLGLEYEYRLAPRVGVGAFVERVSGINRSLVFGGQLYWHAVADLVLTAGPGLDRSHDEWNAVWRLGALYEFPLEEGIFLAPAIAYDFTEHEDIIVYGLSVGFSF
jgi:hypothetical protein